MADSVQALLDSLVQSIGIEALGPQTLGAGGVATAGLGETLRFRLWPQVWGSGTYFLTGPVDLSFIAKQVVFDPAPNLTTNPWDPSVDRGVPVYDQTSRQIGGTLTPDLANPAQTDITGTVTTPKIPGVPGLIARVTGTLPFPTELDVHVEVEWSIKQLPPGAPLEVPVDCAAFPTLVEGDDFAAPNGLTSPALSLLLSPVVVPAGVNAPQTALRRIICAKVRLFASGGTTNWVYLHVPVDVPELPVPTMVAIFEHGGFNQNAFGFLYVMAPANSPVIRDEVTFGAELDRLAAIPTALQGISRFAAFVTGIRELKNGVGRSPGFRVTNADSIGDLVNTIDNKASSLIVVGVLGTRVECFEAKDFFRLALTNPPSSAAGDRKSVV